MEHKKFLAQQGEGGDEGSRGPQAEGKLTNSARPPGRHQLRERDLLADGPTVEELIKDTIWPAVRGLYAHNPFYLISACLILLGLNATFGTSTDEASAWTLLEVLLGYTALMAGTGILIVRIGKVWEDARSILLVVALLFVAISMSFDEILITQPAAARWILLLGLAFAALVTEALLGTLRIRLRLWFRLPYYALLALFFGAPLLLEQVFRQTTDLTTRWWLYGFAPASGLIVLALLPAARKGAAYVRENGTPWRWPWFPWTVFALLVGGVAVRSYSLTLTFAPARAMDSMFGLYFLTPLIVAAAVVVLEIGLVAGSRRTQIAALVMPFVAIVLAHPVARGNQAYAEFLEAHTYVLGSPVLVATVLAVIFSAYAAVLRRAEGAIAGLTFALVLTSFIGVRTTGPGSLAGPHAVPLLLAAMVQGFVALRTERAAHLFLTCVFTLLAVTSLLEGNWFLFGGGEVPLHLLLGAMLVIGAVFRDEFAAALRWIAMAMLVLLFLRAMVLDDAAVRLIGEGGVWAYLGALVGLAFGYGLLVRSPAYFGAGLATLLLYLGKGGRSAYHNVYAEYGRKVALPFFLGGVAFVVAVVISLSKMRGGVRHIARAVAAAYRPHD